MKKFCAVYFLVLLSSFGNNLPAAITYTFCATTGTYAYINATGTSIAELYGGGDDISSNAYNIGFNFNYDGNVYAQFKASSNGCLFLGSGAPSCGADPCGSPIGDANNLAAVAASLRPMLAPLWDDLAIFSGVYYQVTGSSPNRVLTVEWYKMQWRFSAASAGMSFQVKLYETSNYIEFWYNQEAGALSASPTASIGIAGTAAGDYYSLNGTGASPSASKAASTNTLSTKPATGQIYQWKPGAVACGLPIELYSFTGKSAEEKNILEWVTATETNNDYFTIEKSDDGLAFTTLTRVKGAGNSSTALKYTAADLEPNAGKTFYRLKQTDYDGKYTYSEIIVVSNSFGNIAYISPNPVNDNLHLYFYSEKTGTMVLNITNTLGQPILNKSVEVSVGKNTADIDLNTLSKGIYIIKLNAGNSSICKQTKFLKL